MVNKENVKELTKNLFYHIDDDQVEKVVTQIESIDKTLKNLNEKIKDKDVVPADYPRTVNCSVLRADVIPSKEDKDYLSNAKVADKYVIGK